MDRISSLRRGGDGRASVYVGRFAVITILSALLLVGSPAARRARAQTHVGNAYAAKVSVDVLNVGGAQDLVNVSVADTGSLPAPGGSLSASLLSVNLTAGADVPLVSSLFTVLSSGTATGSTVGGSGLTSSNARIEGVNAFPGFFLLGLNSTSLLSATVIESTTTADGGGTVGFSTFADLLFAGTQIAPTGALNETFYVNAFGQVRDTTYGIGDVARLVLNRQTVDGSGARTTDAVALTVLDDGLLLGLASADVVLASSTAGFQAATAAVPEPGSALLVGIGLVLVSGGVAARARRRDTRS